MSGTVYGQRLKKRWLFDPYYIAVLAVCGLASLLRFWHLDRPGYDVDESVYERISASFAAGGPIAAKTEYISNRPKLYTSHPPFPFMTEGLWFKLIGEHGLVEARWLSAGASVLTLLLLAGFLRKLIGNWALLAVALISFDGWITFTNRVGWLENIQFPLGIAALWFYYNVSKKPTRNRLFLAGLALAGVMVFKHVGVYFLLAAMIHRVITVKRQPKPQPAFAWPRRWLVYLGRAIAAGFRSLGSPLVLAPLALSAIYVAGMTAWAGNEYLQSSWHQVQRATGQSKSRGAVSKGSDIVGPLLHQYGIYVATVLVLAIAGILVGVRVLQALRSRCMEPLRRADATLFAWAVAAYGAFGLIGLKLPHYLFLIMLPAYCYLVAELRYWVQRKKWGSRAHRVRMVMVGVLSASLALSGIYATYVRVVANQDNAVGQTIAWFQANADTSARVIADEFVGNQLQQPYCEIKHAQLCEQLGGVPDYIVAYTTTTQKLPESAALTRMLHFDNREYKAVVVARFSGFKEVIEIYRIERKAPTS